MSDFLDNLIANSRGTTGDIRPYLPSRFEPFTSSEPHLGADDEMSFAETAVPTAPALDAAPLPVRRAETAAPTDARTPAALSTESPPPPREPEAPALARARSADASPPREPARHASEAAPRERLVERAVLVEREGGRPAEMRPAEMTARSSGDRGEQAPQANTLLIVEERPATAWRDEPAAHGVPSHEPAPAVAARAHAEETPQALGTGARRRVGVVTPQSLGAQSGSEPDVHVTIGRVEIKAVAPPSKQPVRPKAPQPMTLDEYLRRRTSGEHG